MIMITHLIAAVIGATLGVFIMCALILAGKDDNQNE